MTTKNEKVECPNCSGHGTWEEIEEDDDDEGPYLEDVSCCVCKGTGLLQKEEVKMTKVDEEFSAEEIELPSLEIVLEWMEKAEKKCHSIGKIDSAYLWHDAQKHLKMAFAERDKWKLLSESSERKLEYIKMGIQDHFLTAIEERDRYRDALEWYANPNNIEQCPQAVEFNNEWGGDMNEISKVAQEALNPKGTK